MDINQIARQIKSMKGLMPEPNRTKVAYRFLEMIGTYIKSVGGENFQIWQSGGCNGWLQSCELTAALPKVGEAFDLSVSDLANYINRWSGAETYKPDAEPDSDFKPLTAEMNYIRFTMLTELIEIYKQKGGDVVELKLG